MPNIRDLSGVAPHEMAALDSLMPPDWPDVWHDFGRVFYVGLLGAGLDAPREALAVIAIEQVRVMGHQLGGQQCYIPADTAGKRAEVARRVSAEFTDVNYAELAHRHGLSDSRVRRILRAEQEKGKTTRQKGAQGTVIKPLARTGPFLKALYSRP